MQEVNLRLHPNHCNKLLQRQSFQLNHDQLVNGSGVHHAALHMKIKHVKQIEKAHREGKGYRFSPEKVHGGSIRDYFKKAKNVLHSVGVTDNMMRSAGNSAVHQAELYANQHGAPPMVSHVVANYAHGKINGGRIHEHEHEHCHGGKLRKGSTEAKEHMKRLREMRKSKGKGLPKINIHQVKSVAKAIIHPVVSYGIGALATEATGNPLLGAVAGSVGGNYVNGKIDHAIGNGLRRKRVIHGKSPFPISSVRGNGMMSPYPIS